MSEPHQAAILPRGRLGTRARRGVVRAKTAVYSGKANIYGDWPDAGATETRCEAKSRSLRPKGLSYSSG